MVIFPVSGIWTDIKRWQKWEFCGIYKITYMGFGLETVEGKLKNLCKTLNPKENKHMHSAA